MKSKLTFEPTTPSQAAALAAVKDDAFLEKSVLHVIKERDKLGLFFENHGIDYVPSISNSVMMICESEHGGWAVYTGYARKWSYLTTA